MVSENGAFVDHLQMYDSYLGAENVLVNEHNACLDCILKVLVLRIGFKENWRETERQIREAENVVSD